MTDTMKKDRPTRRPDCVTEVRRGNSRTRYEGQHQQKEQER